MISTKNNSATEHSTTKLITSFYLTIAVSAWAFLCQTCGMLAGNTPPSTAYLPLYQYLPTIVPIPTYHCTNTVQPRLSELRLSERESLLSRNPMPPHVPWSRCHGNHVISVQTALSWGGCAPPPFWIVDQCFLTLHPRPKNPKF